MSISNIPNSNISFKAKLFLHGDVDDLTPYKKNKLRKRAELIGNNHDIIDITVGKLSVGKKSYDSRFHIDTTPVQRKVKLETNLNGVNVIENSTMFGIVHSGQSVINPFSLVNKILEDLHEQYPSFVEPSENSKNNVDQNRSSIIKILSRFLFSRETRIPKEVRDYIKDTYNVSVEKQKEQQKTGKTPIGFYKNSMCSFYADLLDNAKQLSEQEYIDLLNQGQSLSDYDNKIRKLEEYIDDNYMFADEKKPNCAAQKILENR